MKAVLYRKHLLWRVKLVAENGETLLVSETYYSKSNGQRALNKLNKELK